MSDDEKENSFNQKFNNVTLAKQTDHLTWFIQVSQAVKWKIAASYMYFFSCFFFIP